MRGGGVEEGGVKGEESEKGEIKGRIVTKERESK